MDHRLLSNNYFSLISVIRQKLLEKGANTIATLPRLFKAFPSYDGISKLNESDFYQALTAAGLHLSKEDERLIGYFVKGTDSLFDFEKFLFALRGNPNSKRQAAIDIVFYIFSKKNTDLALASEMKTVFNCEEHPKFKMGKLSKEQMFYLYLKNFSNVVKDTVSKKVRILF